MSQPDRIHLCRHHGCGKQATLSVAGGLKTGESVGGWRGIYCLKHALTCVQAQIYQVVHGMPITMSPLPPEPTRLRAESNRGAPHPRGRH